jgi:hypothetical protein
MRCPAGRELSLTRQIMALDLLMLSAQFEQSQNRKRWLLCFACD